MFATFVAAALMTIGKVETPKKAPTPTQTQTKKSTERAKIRPGDELQLTVITNPEYSGRYRVVEDGWISVVPVGHINCEGRTLTDVEDEIRRRLRTFLVDPSIVLSFFSRADADIYVVSAESAGRVPWRRDLDVRAAISTLRTTANDLDDYVVRLFRDGEKIAEFNLQDALVGDKTKYYTEPLEPRDLISVVSRETTRVYVSYEFQRSGELLVREGTTLSEVLARTGAPILPTVPTGRISVFEDRTRVVVRRGNDTFPFRLRNDPEASKFVVQAGDVVGLSLPRRISVTVNGAVKEDRDVTLLEGDDVRNAIAATGGPDDDGTLEGVMVWHDNQVRRFDLRSSNPNAPSIPLDDGDIVVVPKNQRFFHVLGLAKKPGEYVMVDDRKLTVRDAISKAGGIEKDGTLRRMILMRPDETGVYKPIVFNHDEFLKDGKVEANPEIRPGDVLYVSSSRNAFGIQQISSIISGLLLVNNVSRN